MEAPPDASSRILAGKYRLLRPLGQGGMSSVWCAEHLGLRSLVAIKLLDPDVARRHQSVPRFMREAQMAASLRSPHVVQVLDHGIDGDQPYIVMELLEGESLEARLMRLGRLTPSETIRVVTHVARALTRAHEEGIVHRDLKPANVFLVHNDEEELAKVLDFGIAKLTTTDLRGAAFTSTRAGVLLGSPSYMSPEQIETGRQLDFRTDVWAMGVLAFECLLGQRPFSGDTVANVFWAILSRPLPVPSELGAVPVGFDEWFAKACSRSLERRFASAREASLELRAVCERSPLTLTSETFGAVVPASVGHTLPLERPRVHSPLRRWAKRTAIALPVIGVAAGIGVLARSNHESRAPTGDSHAAAPLVSTALGPSVEPGTPLPTTLTVPSASANVAALASSSRQARRPAPARSPKLKTNARPGTKVDLGI